MSEIFLYGAVGATELTTRSVVDKIRASKGKTIKVRINSQGGDVIEGLGIYNALKEHGGVEVYIDGLAASMGSVIAMAGAKVFMAANALMMIHKPWTHSAEGNSDQLREQAQMLDKFEGSLLKAYTTKTGLPDAQITEMLAKETWLDAEQAKELGFIDFITDANEMAASVDLSAFSHPPKRGRSAQDKAHIEFLLTALAGVSEEDKKAFQIKTENPTASIEELRAEAMTLIGKDQTPTGGCVMTTQNDNVNEFIKDAAGALLLRAGIQHKHSDSVRNLAKYNPVNLAEKLVQMKGVSTAGMDARQILSKAFTIRNQHSTSDFSLLLGNTAGKALRMAYEEEPATFTGWTGETEVPDFKQKSLIQLSEAPDLELVTEGGEYTHGSFSDAAEVFQIAKYGKLFSITYEALVNDDLDGFTRLPQAFGKSARRKEADLVYGVLTSNPTLNDGVALFHADHANLGTVASTSVDLAALQAGRLLMRKQKGLNSLQPLNIAPRFLIVPAALESEAEQLLASLVDPTKSNATPNNEFVRSLELVVDSRLDADSTSKFYLAANPGQVDTITRAYLAGAARPHYETKDGWEVDGMSVKCRLEVAAVPVDYRGLVQITLS